MAVIMVLAAGLSYTYKAAAPAIAPQIDAENTPIYTAAEPQPEPEFVEAFVYDMKRYSRKKCSVKINGIVDMMLLRKATYSRWKRKIDYGIQRY